MTQQNNNPEDPRDSSKDLTRPLNAPDENIQSSEPTSHEAEATAPHQRSSQGNVDSSSQQSPPKAPLRTRALRVATGRTIPTSPVPTASNHSPGSMGRTKMFSRIMLTLKQALRVTQLMKTTTVSRTPTAPPPTLMAVHRPANEVTTYSVSLLWGHQFLV